ncbi:MAG: valine--pyruvate transaminase [Deltaproteobacteria bacterium]|nr:MAG: valine--pyruvate transaminase [Deltaproteobacteria bacterium]
MELSSFGEKFTSESGILKLMEDLGNALAGGRDMIMMGGGNPGYVPEIEDALKKRMEDILADPDQFRRLTGIYDPPQGEKEFIGLLAEMLNKKFSWNLEEKNIAITNGSQSSFFILFNMFAGKMPDGSLKKILLPIAPEYIGYADTGLTEAFFVSYKPRIDFFDNRLFKYRVDFDSLEINDEIGAVCVSRPTNPTGNVITDNEVEKLSLLTEKNNIPFILDSAYGTPFPDIIFNEAKPFWNKNTILCMSLSKFGLPAARTGIVIADESIIKNFSGINAIMNLAPGSFGAMMALDMVKSGDITKFSREFINPYYMEKSKNAVELFHEALEGTDYYIHKPEGAIFLWLWFKDMKITSYELYERLKARGVIVVPGNYFFPGIYDNSWKHRDECIRVTYSQEPEKVRKGIKIIGEEVRKAYS